MEFVPVELPYVFIAHAWRSRLGSIEANIGKVSICKYAFVYCRRVNRIVNIEFTVFLSDI